MQKRGEPVVGQLLPLSFSIDHRVINGVQGEEILHAFMDLLQSPQ